MTSKEVYKQLQEDRLQLDALYTKFDTGQKLTTADGRDVAVYDFPPGEEEAIRNFQAEINRKADEADALFHEEQKMENASQLRDLGETKRRIVGVPGLVSKPYHEPMNGGGRSLGKLFIESHEYKLRGQRGGLASAEFDDIDFKTLLTTGGAPGYAPDSPRSSIVVPYAERTPVVADLIPIVVSEVPVHKWMEEQAPTNNASQIGEGVAKPESTLDWNEVTETLTKIAHWVQVTQEQVDDVPGLVSLIDNRLVRLLELQEETQLLYGNGAGNNMQGFLTHSGLQTQAFSTNNADTALKAITKVMHTGFARPTGIIMNPSNWETARLLKGATNVDYIMGSPLIDVTPRLWGLPVILTTAITAGTALVGDFARYSEIRRKMGIRVEIANQHGENFVSNILVILAEMRELLAIYRGAAFCQCTSLT